MEKEIWKDIIGYEGLYQVSNLGRIKSLPRKTKNQFGKKELIMKQIYDKYGYKVISIKGKTKKVHRIVAEAFLKNINNYPIVNHKDGNKANNKVDNLEWCTNKYNIIHAYKNNLIKIKKGKYNLHNKPIILKKDKKIIKCYSVTNASEKLGVAISAVSNCLRGRSKKCKGYEIYYGK